MVSTVTKTWIYDNAIISGQETTTIISKGDTYISSSNATTAYGLSNSLYVGQTAGGDRLRSLISIEMPPQPENAGRIRSLDLYLYQVTYTGTSGIVLARRCVEDFVEGYSGAALPYGATWNTYDGKNSWPILAGNCGDEVLGAANANPTYNASYQPINLNTAIFRNGLTWGGVLDIALYMDDEPAGEDVQYRSRDVVAQGERPYIQIVYELDEPEIPDGEDEILTIEPNPANPIQPLLKWKKPENQSLRIDNRGAYCIVRSESIIDDITDGYLIAQLSTEAQQYVDTTVVAPSDGLTENNLYYYKVYFCSETNYLDNTAGLPILMTTVDSNDDIIGVPISSNQVWMIRPNVSTFVFDNYGPDVKEQITATITADVAGDFALTPSPVQHTHYQFDWKGDDTEVGWVELETPANSHAKTHYYLGYQGATPAKCRIKNSLGYWSDATSSANVTVAAITPVSIINVSPKAMTHIVRDSGTATGTQTANTLQDTNKTWTINEFAGLTITIHLDGGQLYESRLISSNTIDTITIAPNWSNNPVTTTTQYEIVTAYNGVLRVLANLSYAQSSNETITKYEFRLQRTSDSAYYDSTGPPFWVAGVTWNDLLTVPYMDVTATNMGAEDTYTCLARVTSSSFGVDATPDSTTMTVTTVSSTDMKATLVNSNFETQNLGRKRIKSRHRIIEGTSETIIDSGKEMPQIRISGHSYGVNIKTDEAQLLTWQDDDTYLKVYTDPQEGTPAKYVEGWIEGLRFTKRLPKSVAWECNIVCRVVSL